MCPLLDLKSRISHDCFSIFAFRKSRRVTGRRNLSLNRTNFSNSESAKSFLLAVSELLSTPFVTKIHLEKEYVGVFFEIF